MARSNGHDESRFFLSSNISLLIAFRVLHAGVGCLFW
uniref:Uncharacterized protein n=1 Tax=Arundo donax TaxID=35708 RepID=A0A0A9HIK6_ARUDO